MASVRGSWETLSLDQQQWWGGSTMSVVEYFDVVDFVIMVVGWAILSFLLAAGFIWTDDDAPKR